ncbi:His/Gly/Thr/Pro-type tRNA ligase C-terminal domain-containing protein, partial [Thiolapillus sp.]
EKLYKDLLAAGIDVLFDDRDQRPGVMFADHELMGIPLRVVVGERSLDQGEVEFRIRSADENEMISLEDIVSHIQSLLET